MNSHPHPKDLVNFPLLSLPKIQEFGNFSEEKWTKITQIIMIMRKCKAASRYHGAYPGGLWDHVRLVISLACHIHSSLNSQVIRADLVRAALYHDWGKMLVHPNANFRKFVERHYVFKPPRKLEDIAFMIEQKFGYTIAHPYQTLTSPRDHTLKSLYILANMKFKENSEVIKAIMFHHGGWSDFKRDGRTDDTPTAAILHSADLIAAHTLEI